MIQNKALVTDFIQKIWNDGKYDLIPNFIDPAYVAWALGSKKTLRGLEAVEENVKGVHTAFPDFSITIEDMIAEGEKVVSRLTLHALEGTKAITMREIIIHRISGGKIVKAWALGSKWD